MFNLPSPLPIEDGTLMLCVGGVPNEAPAGALRAIGTTKTLNKSAPAPAPTIVGIVACSYCSFGLYSELCFNYGV